MSCVNNNCGYDFNRYRNVTQTTQTNMAATGKKDTTPSEIEELAKVLEGRAEKLRTYANIIRTRKLKTIPLSNRPMADRGVKQVDGYLLKIQAELGLV